MKPIVGTVVAALLSAAVPVGASAESPTYLYRAKPASIAPSSANQPGPVPTPVPTPTPEPEPGPVPADVEPRILAAAAAACSGTWRKVATVTEGSVPAGPAIAELVNGRQYLVAFADVSEARVLNYLSDRPVTVPASGCGADGAFRLRMLSSTGGDTPWAAARQCSASAGAFYIGNFDHPAWNGWSDSVGPSFGRLSTNASPNTFNLPDKPSAFLRTSVGDGWLPRMSRVSGRDSAEVHVCR